MTVFLVILGFLLLLLALLLFLPLSYSFRFDLGEDIAYRALGGSALFAFVAERRENNTMLRLRLLGIPVRIRPGEKEKQESDKPEKKKEKKGAGFPWFILKKETVKHFARFVIELLVMIKPRVFRVNARVGFVEPDLNGMAMALIYSLRSVFPEFGLHWETAWEEETAEADGEIAGHIMPAAVLWRALVFLFSRPTLRILR
jgi:hypothetical protein